MRREQAMASPTQWGSCFSRAEWQQGWAAAAGSHAARSERGGSIRGTVASLSFHKQNKVNIPSSHDLRSQMKKIPSHTVFLQTIISMLFNSLAHVPGLCAVERHWSPAKLCLGLYAHQLLETQGSNSVKTPAILRHDSLSSHARSWAHLCSRSPGEQILAYPSNLPLRSQGQSWHAKPRYTPETTQSLRHAFPVPRTAGIFTSLCKSPQGLQQRQHVDSFTSSLRQGPTPSASPLKHTSL